MSHAGAEMRIQDAVATLAELRGDAIAVVTMSALPFWPSGADDYRLLGLMGGAGSIGLGLALGRPDRLVWVIDGDGSLLMQLGVLSAIGGAVPANLTHVVIANGVYAVSGAQPIPRSPDWPSLFLAAGYASAQQCSSLTGLRSVLAMSEPGPRGISVVTSAERPRYPAGAFSHDPAAEAARLRAALAR
jgi:thiamine pyrophosphate-dependent acetolactate synthase large subunit-like protein